MSERVYRRAYKHNTIKEVQYEYYNWTKRNNPHKQLVSRMEWNGKSILDFMEAKANCPYGHAKQVIENEGGYVDSNGIIHMGTAENKIVEIE